MRRTLLTWFAFIVLALGAIGLWGYAGDTDPVSMSVKYAGAEARFATDVDARVHYRASGSVTAPVLVMLHGSSSSLLTFEPLRARLDDTYRVIAIDLPGHGFTGANPERDYSVRRMISAVKAVMDAEAVESAVLVGNSRGGLVAWHFALSHPTRVEALVLIAASGAAEPPKANGNLGFALMSQPAMRGILQWFTPRAFIARSVRQTIGDDALVDDALIDQYWELLRLPGNRGALADAMVTRPPDRSIDLGRITAPTLIVWGAEDAIIPPTDAALFDAGIPTSTAIIYPEIGHLPQFEAPDAVAGDIRWFLTEIASGTGPKLGEATPPGATTP